MRKTLLATAFALLIAACSSEDVVSSSTSTLPPGESSSTTAPATTTTELPASTTTSSTTTSTTTTTLPPTTTTSLLSGNWASQPLVTTDFAALGWWDGLQWIDAESEGALPIVGGEDYQVTLNSQSGLTSGGPQTLVCEPLNLLGVDLADPGLLGDFPGPYGVAISAPWELTTHLVEEVGDDGTYAAFAAEFLASRGLVVAEPVIKQLFRLDLEGDGVNEVLFVAEEVTPGFLMQVGDYSVVLLRKVVDGNVQTAVLAQTIVLGEDDQFLGSHTVGSIADLSGDGKMEIVTNSAFFEGFGVSVWEYLNDDFGPVQVLQAGCGS